MDKKSAFKEFAQLHPELVDYVKNNDMTWQKFYEIYDIYGDKEDAWKDYLTPKKDPLNMDNITDKLKNIDVSSIQEHIKTAQKALALISELTTKTSTTSPLTASVAKVPRPINKFFED